VLRIEVYKVTGRHATNGKVARRLNKKIKSLLSLGQTVLLDYERVEVIDDSFFATVLHLDDHRQIKVCGLTPPIRAALLDRQVEGSSTIAR
jgi:hypothetical protein